MERNILDHGFLDTSSPGFGVWLYHYLTYLGAVGVSHKGRARPKRDSGVLAGRM